MKKGMLLFTFLFSLLFAVGLVLGQGHGDQFVIHSGPGHQAFCQAEYDPVNMKYLAVWEDMRTDGDTDISAVFISSDGTLIGDIFSVCATDGQQWWPRLAFDPDLQRFLVVFEDNRNGDAQGDVRGVFVNSDGTFADAAASDADHSFGIATGIHDIYTCSVAYNFKDKVFLAVWGDNRVAGVKTTEQWGRDIYGQLIDQNGNLILPGDGAENFAVDKADWYEASVPDVTYNAVTNEFFVVYGTSIGFVLGQRVNSNAELIAPDGTKASLAKTNSVAPAMFISQQFNNGPDCLQARAAARTGYKFKGFDPLLYVSSTEVQVVWKGVLDNTDDNDVYGQRIGFALQDGLFVASWLNLNGEATDTQSNFPISIQPGWAGLADLAYNENDDEFLVAWGDPRDSDSNDNDLYMQRLWINGQQEMVFLADDRVNTVTHTENIPLAATEADERTPGGVAYDNRSNNYLVLYQTGAWDAPDGFDAVANLVYGPDIPSAVDESAVPADFVLAQNFPNPFNPTTHIAFDLKHQERVRLRVFNVQGEEIAELLHQSCEPGHHEVIFNASDLASGIYFYKLQAGGRVITKKMILME